jgi:hypothetical protein
MYDFLLQIFFFGALTVAVYLMARALPRVTEDDSKISPLEYLEKILSRLPVTKVDRLINLRLEKFLRKVRVMILRLDNLIHHYLNSKKENGEIEQLKKEG